VAGALALGGKTEEAGLVQPGEGTALGHLTVPGSAHEDTVKKMDADS